MPIRRPWRQPGSKGGLRERVLRQRRQNDAAHYEARYNASASRSANATGQSRYEDGTVKKLSQTQVAWASWEGEAPSEPTTAGVFFRNGSAGASPSDFKIVSKSVIKSVITASVGRKPKTGMQEERGKGKGVGAARCFPRKHRHFECFIQSIRTLGTDWS